MPDLPLLDCDVLVGREPRAFLDASPDRVTAALSAAGLAGGAVASLRALHFDVPSGNDECARVAAERGWTPVAAVDLRDPLGAERALDLAVERGWRAVRLAPGVQAVEPDYPAFRYVAREIVARGLVALVEGDVRRVWQPFAGLGADVVFLDTHFYHLGDFVVAAMAEPGFRTSTRLLNGPDAIETVVDRLGPERLLLGTRAPLFQSESAVRRLMAARLEPKAREAIASGNLRDLLELG